MSMKNQSEEIKFSIEQLEEILSRKIDRVKDEVKNLENGFETFKRQTKIKKF